MPDSGPVPECSACGTSRLELSERIAALRSVLVDSINALECSFASPEVSDAFLANLPAEIKGQIEGKNARIAALEAELATQAHAAMRAQERVAELEAQVCRMRTNLSSIQSKVDRELAEPESSDTACLMGISDEIDGFLSVSAPCPHAAEVEQLWGLLAECEGWLSSEAPGEFTERVQAAAEGRYAGLTANELERLAAQAEGGADA